MLLQYFSMLLRSFLLSVSIDGFVSSTICLHIYILLFCYLSPHAENRMLRINIKSPTQINIDFFFSYFAFFRLYR